MTAKLEETVQHCQRQNTEVLVRVRKGARPLPFSISCKTVVYSQIGL